MPPTKKPLKRKPWNIVPYIPQGNVPCAPVSFAVKDEAGC